MHHDGACALAVQMLKVMKDGAYPEGLNKKDVVAIRKLVLFILFVNWTISAG